MAISPPHHSEQVRVTLFPHDHVLLLTMNRPKSLNAMTPQMTNDLKVLLDWFENEPSLWVVIVTGAGRLFCAGADLKSWNTDKQSGSNNEQESTAASVHGFASVSRRQSIKPIIAAVNGGAYGGGVEMILNCDLIVAADDAKFALPEVKRGVVAGQGGIPRLSQIAGHQLASEMLLLGKTITAGEAHTRFGFVNAVVPASQLMSKAMEFAKQIIENSPDAVQSTKKGLLLSQQLDPQGAFHTNVWSPESKRVYVGENIKEGLKAFNERRPPGWKNPAKL